MEIKQKLFGPVELYKFQELLLNEEQHMHKDYMQEKEYLCQVVVVSQLLHWTI